MVMNELTRQLLASGLGPSQRGAGACAAGDTADARQTTIRCSNDELGVWVAGADLPSLLAPHSSWTSIVPYKREAVKPYGADVPWSWPAYASKKGLRATGIDGDDLADWQR